MARTLRATKVRRKNPSSPTYRPTSKPNLPMEQLTHQVRILQKALSELQREFKDLSSASNPTVSPLRRAFLIASSDPHRAASLLINHAANAPVDVLLDLARVCFEAPVGRIGERHAVRTVGVLLCDEILRQHPEHTDALCLKGEALLPYIHYGKNDPCAPRSVMQEAYQLFDVASKHGSTLGTFLKGRWLLSMEPLHKSSEQAQLGVSCVKTAADEMCPRALVFLAHRYECPQLDRAVSFAADLPKGKAQRERFILSFYKKAADRGNPDAINDIGTSYAEGYANLERDFDKAVEHYVRAIEAGSLHAFDNLGTHYETGMAGRFPNRINLEKALHYYRQGAQQRCPKCAHNLAVAYDEGMSGAVQRNDTKAERYYIRALRLADDANDIVTAARSAKDLAALYFTRIKVNEPDSAVSITARKRLFSIVGDEAAIHRTMLKIDKAMAAGVRGKITSLTKLVGDMNCKLIVSHAKSIEEKLKSGDNSQKEHDVLNPMLVTKKDEDVVVTENPAVGQKRSRVTNWLPGRRFVPISRKKRKTSTSTQRPRVR